MYAQAVGAKCSLALNGDFLGCSNDSKEARVARVERTREIV